MSSNLPAMQHNEAALIPSTGEWQIFREMASSLVKTGFLPEAIKTPEQAVAVMLKGRELAIPPMYALSNIAIVKGKPTISAELMLALIHRSHGQRAIRVKESSDTQCVVEYRMAGWNDVQTYAFTIDQAKQAGLLSNQTWTKYPAAMLRARCISAVARMAFPGSIGGMYVPGELGDAVDVTDEGEVVSVAPVADHATGEIVDAPQTRQIGSGRAEPAGQASGDPEAVMKRLHATLADHSITHTDLHDYYAAKGFASLTDVPTATLERMARWASRETTASVQGEFARVLAPATQPALVAADAVTGEPGNDAYTG
jgi:hypothetical protein